MLVNLSNHPSTQWSDSQRNAAIEQYGGIKDLQFPMISPDADTETVSQLAADYCKIVLDLKVDDCFAVHVMGEMSFTYSIVGKLKSNGISCILSTTERNVVDNADGSKTVFFNFVRFREYM